MKILGKMRIALAVFAFVAGTALAADVRVRAVGVGKTYQTAVGEALASALEQHQGVTLSTMQRSELVNAVTTTSATTNDQTTDRREIALNDAATKTVLRLANGRIAGYTILSEGVDAATGCRRVEVSVRFTGPYVVGGDPADRRRMAVLPFRAAVETYTWYGQTSRAADWCAMLEDKLNVCLTQTRKFTMLDRKFDDEVTAELARLPDENAAPADVTRLAQRLGTDYLIVGEVRFNNVQPLTEDSGAWRALSPANVIFAEITYRVLLAPTGQLKWSDVVKIDASAFAVHDLSAFVSATTEAAACSISDGLMANILPFEIVGRTASGLLVIGEGGKALEVGERLIAFVQGEEVKDTRTGEVIDVIEEVAGTAQVVRVTAKLSYAKVVDGDAAKMVKGTRLRQMQVVKPPQVEHQIVGRAANGLLVIDEGGKSLKCGECFAVVAHGEEVKNARTGEVLDVIENDVGMVQIVRVTEKLSYAQVVDGDATKMVEGARLRPMPADFMHSRVNLKKRKLKDRVMALCRLPLNYSTAGKWFKLAKEIESDELRQLALKASGAALLASGRADVYSAKVKPLLEDAESFRTSFEAQCTKCDGVGVVEESCKACSGSGRCGNAACCEGRRFVRRLNGRSFWTLCSDCKGSATCQKCKATGKCQTKCIRCKGKRVAMNKNAAATAYHDFVKAISASFKESESEP